MIEIIEREQDCQFDDSERMFGCQMLQILTKNTFISFSSTSDLVFTISRYVTYKARAHATHLPQYSATLDRTDVCMSVDKHHRHERQIDFEWSDTKMLLMKVWWWIFSGSIGVSLCPATAQNTHRQHELRTHSYIHISTENWSSSIHCCFI